MKQSHTIDEELAHSDNLDELLGVGNQSVAFSARGTLRINSLADHAFKKIAEIPEYLESTPEIGMTISRKVSPAKAKKVSPKKRFRRDSSSTE